MKLIKSSMAGNMTTEKLHLRMSISIHAPDLVNDVGCTALVKKATAKFWSSAKRSPGRAVGARASNKKRKIKNNAVKSAAAVTLVAATKSSNAAIASTGTAAGGRPSFERVGYIALPSPKDDDELVGKTAAVIFREGDGEFGPGAWVLGKIDSLKSSDAHAVGGSSSSLGAKKNKKKKYLWKSIEDARGAEWQLECHKSFKPVDYGLMWVLYQEEPAAKLTKTNAKAAAVAAKADVEAKDAAAVFKADAKAAKRARKAARAKEAAGEPPTKERKQSRKVIENMEQKDQTKKTRKSK